MADALTPGNSRPSSPKPKIPVQAGKSSQADMLANNTQGTTSLGETSEGVATDWAAIEASGEFQELVKARFKFIIPATIFFLIYFFALPISVGFFRDLMNTKIIGDVNLAYLFALSEFVMTWVIAGLYIRQADTVFDRLADAVRVRFRKGGR